MSEVLHVCISIHQCYAAAFIDHDGYDIRTKGCLENEDSYELNCRTGPGPSIAIMCCESEYCNADLYPTYATVPSDSQPGEALGKLLTTAETNKLLTLSPIQLKKIHCFKMCETVSQLQCICHPFLTRKSSWPLPSCSP